MINYEVITTEQADYDLRGIYEYIAYELLAPGNAAGQFDRLEVGIIGLETFPERFKVYEKEPWKRCGYSIKILHRNLENVTFAVYIAVKVTFLVL